MLTFTLIFLLLSNSITLRRDKSILFSRATIIILLVSAFITYVNLYFLFLNKGIGIFGGLFQATTLTGVFHIFIFLITSVILLLTSFYARKVWLEAYSSLDSLLFTELVYCETNIVNKMGQQYKIIEYPLIILFVVTGAVFFISTSDLVSVFLAIELQSYGLYLISAIYRDSEPATSGSLMYFLLGGLSSCFILLSISLLYANSGTTNLDSLYIITSLSNVSKDNLTGLLYWYKSYYIHLSLLFMSVGFLFKVSAAPFHFWSPDVYDAIPTIVTSFVAIIAKISIFIFLLELVHYTSKSMFDMDFSWTMSLLFSSLLSLVIGTIVGLTQSRIKRLFAFSTISHVGFILLALTIHSVESTQAFIFYLMQYSISNLNAFILLIAIGYSLYFYVYKYDNIDFSSRDREFSKDIFHTNLLNTDKDVKNGKDVKDLKHDNSANGNVNKANNIHDVKDVIEAKDRESIEEDLEKLAKHLEKVKMIEENKNNLQDMNHSPIQLIDQLKGYYYINPLLSLSMGITLFSFAGIPPLIGFFAKQMVLSAAIDSGYIFMSLVAIVTSVISAVYYLVIIKQIFFNKPDYQLVPYLNSLSIDGIITEKNTIKKINLGLNNIVISSSLSLSISIITFIIAFFIFIPQEWLSLANILALILFNI